MHEREERFSKEKTEKEVKDKHEGNTPSNSLITIPPSEQ
jgi:hypothetical protein